MTVSYGEFVRQARGLVAMSERLGDGWELRTTDGPEEILYLIKKSTEIVDFRGPPAENFREPETPLDVGDRENIEDEDPAALHDSSSSCRSAAVYFEYHVVYSPSYRVPVLYFTVTFPTGKLVPLQKVWQFMSPAHVARESGTEWGTVTQQEHPLLCCPFYHIHPCRTADVMGTVVRAHGNETVDSGMETIGHGNERVNSGMETCGHGNETGDIHEDANGYLLSWLTIFGPTAGLKVPLNYLKFHSKSDV